MHMPEPGPEHEKLKLLAGSWKGEETLFPSPWDPQGGKAEGIVTNAMGASGFVLVHDYVQRRDGRTTFTGHAVFSWNADAKAYHCHWWDSMGMPPNLFVGNFTGDTLVMESEGGAGRSRTTWAMKGNRYDFTMEVSPDGSQWFTFMSGSYARS